MVILFSFIVFFSSFINANTRCVELFQFNNASKKSEKAFKKYSEQRVKYEVSDPPKIFSITQSLKKSEHPYGLYKSGLIQLVYLHLFSKAEKNSTEFLNEIENILTEYQNVSQNLYKQFLNYEVKKQQLKIVKQALEDNPSNQSSIDVTLPRINSEAEVIMETTSYSRALLELHFEYLKTGVKNLTKEVVGEKLTSLELEHAFRYLSLKEILKILNKNIYIYNTDSYVLNRSKNLVSKIEELLEDKSLVPTKTAIKKVYYKISRDNIGFIFRGHKYSEETEELNQKLKDILPEDIQTQFGNKTLYEALRVYSRMNILKRFTGKVIDRTYFKNLFRFKFMGTTALFVTLWLTNPLEFIKNYDFAQSLARQELIINDSRYVYKMRSLDDEKFIEVASDIYLIMSKDFFKEVDGKIQFIKEPGSDVSPVRTILKALEKKREFKEDESAGNRKKEIAYYHTIQTVKLDSLTRVAFSKSDAELRSKINAFLLSEHNASLHISDQVKLMQWISGQRKEKPELELNITPVSKESIIDRLESGLQFDLDIQTINQLHEVINSYGAEKQFDLISASIWRDFETIKVIRQSYNEDFLNAKNPAEFRYQIIEDLAYELTASEFHYQQN